MCYGLKWIEADKNREKDSKHRWEDQFVRGDHLQRIVDVDMVRTSKRSRNCAGWTTSNKMEKRLKKPCWPTDPIFAYQLQKLEQGTRSSRTVYKKEVEREIYDEGIFMAQCGLWHRMEKEGIACTERRKRRL